MRGTCGLSACSLGDRQLAADVIKECIKEAEVIEASLPWRGVLVGVADRLRSLAIFEPRDEGLVVFVVLKCVPGWHDGTLRPRAFLQ